MKTVNDLLASVCITVVALAVIYGAFFALTKETCDEGQTKVSYGVEPAGRYVESATSCVPVEDAIAFIERQQSAEAAR